MTDDNAPYCSICLKPLPDDAVNTINHVMKDHFDNDEFRSFVDEIVVKNVCAKCGTAYWSDVKPLNETVYGARPYCVDCRKSSDALRDLLVDHMDAHELVARGSRRPMLAKRSRNLQNGVSG